VSECQWTECQRTESGAGCGLRCEAGVQAGVQSEVQTSPPELHRSRRTCTPVAAPNASNPSAPGPGVRRSRIRFLASATSAAVKSRLSASHLPPCAFLTAADALNAPLPLACSRRICSARRSNRAERCRGAAAGQYLPRLPVRLTPPCPPPAHHWLRIEVRPIVGIARVSSVLADRAHHGQCQRLCWQICCHLRHLAQVLLQFQLDIWQGVGNCR
jgi:hypothetical protein